MCGVIYVEGNNGADVKNELLNRFEHQKHRGTEGFGFVAVKDGFVVAYERSETEAQMRAALDKVDSPDSILFHHRIPTSTPNYAGTAHPFKISHPSFAFDYYVIHNGVITNTDYLKDDHFDDYGIEYKSAYQTLTGVHFPHQNQYDKKTAYAGKHNDSESIAVELALFLEGRVQKISTTGGAAIIGLQVIKDTNEIESVFYGHNEGRPLVWEQPSAKKRRKNKPTCFVVKSEGQGHNLPADNLYVRDYKTKSEIAYKIEIGFFYQASKQSMGYGASYALPEPEKKKSIVDQIFDGTVGYENAAEKILEFEYEIESLKMERDEWQNELTHETDLGARAELRKRIIEIDAEIKKIHTKIDDYYFNYSADYYTR